MALRSFAALRPSRSTQPLGSKHAGFQPRRLRHHRLIPGWVEHQLRVDLDDGGNQCHLLANVLHQNVTHAATGCGEGDLDRDMAAAILVMTHVAGIHQPQIDDIDRNLRVKAGVQLPPDQFLDVFVARILGQRDRLRWLLADGIGVFASDAEKVAFDSMFIADFSGFGNTRRFANSL